MYKNSLKSSLLLLIMLFVSALTCHDSTAQKSQVVGDKEIDVWIIQMKSDDITIKERATSSLLQIPDDNKTDKIRKALIDEMIRVDTQARQGKFGKGGDEAHADYYTMIINGVARMRDWSAFPYFAKVGYADALILYGDKGIDAILNKIGSESTCAKRMYPVDVISEVLGTNKFGYVAQGSSRENIKKILLQTLIDCKHPDRNTDWFNYRAQECAQVRLRIIKGFGRLIESGDTTVMPLLESIAESDPYYLIPKKQEDVEVSKRQYEVRDVAKKVLADLRSKGKIK